jgi:hypothetical protein
MRGIDGTARNNHLAVILSEAKDLLFATALRKADPSSLRSSG